METTSIASFKRCLAGRRNPKKTGNQSGGGGGGDDHTTAFTSTVLAERLRQVRSALLENTFTFDVKMMVMTMMRTMMMMTVAGKVEDTQHESTR